VRPSLSLFVESSVLMFMGRSWKFPACARHSINCDHPSSPRRRSSPSTSALARLPCRALSLTPATLQPQSSHQHPQPRQQHPSVSS
jgi:hypothetical protein